MRCLLLCTWPRAYIVWYVLYFFLRVLIINDLLSVCYFLLGDTFCCCQVVLQKETYHGAGATRVKESTLLFRWINLMKMISSVKRQQEGRARSIYPRRLYVGWLETFLKTMRHWHLFKRGCFTQRAHVGINWCRFEGGFC